MNNKNSLRKTTGKKTTRNNMYAAIFAVLMLLMPAIALADVDTYVSGPSIRVSMISQDPDPVKPGEYV
ncbi:TPA: hypothetical protein HA265_01770, partial [Candidatus Woesearchaeota archaeon]|nr:hypothetical protein [Candidatus Woesearchaeota archaeon]